jgi:hypothetical protein
MTSFETRSAPSPLPKILQVMFGLGVFVGLGVLTLRGFSLEDLILPMAALGIPVYLIVMVDPILGIAVLIAAIGLSPEMTIGGIRNLRIEDFVVPGLVLGWLLRAGRERTPFAQAHIWLPAVLTMVCMVCTTLAGNAFRSMPIVQSFLIMGKYAEYLVIYLLIINTVKTEGELRALAIFSILIALASSYSSLGTTLGSAANTVEGRVHGPLGETANIYGAYLSLNLLLALGLFLHSPSEGGRVANGAAVVLLGIAILFTYSRTTYVGVAGAILVYGVVKHRRLLLILVILAVILPFLAPESIMERMATVGGVASGATPGSWTARTYAWQVTWAKMAPSDMVFGQGVYSVQFGEVDSEYVRILADTGIVGLILFGWVLLRFGGLAYRTHDRLVEYTFPRGYLAGYLMILIAMMIHSVAATTFSAIRTEETFMVFTGFMTVIANSRESMVPADGSRPVVLLADAPVLEPQRR